MNILYLVTKPAFRFEGVWKIEDGDSVVLMQDGVFAPPEGTEKYSVCAPDAKVRNVKSGKPEVSYEEIIEMSKSHGKVVTL